jgi:geranylgeranyl diphosphate synthase type II
MSLSPVPLSLPPPVLDELRAHGWVAHVDDLRARIDARLHAWVPEPPPDADLVSIAMHACVSAPGKRLRPLLLLLAAEDLGVEAGTVIDAACALEMVHAASLALDDLPCMDDALVRRGRPALHVDHGQDIAILAAVALLGQAFNAAASSSLAPSVRLRCMTVLAESIGPRGLVGGQCRDLRDGRNSRSIEAIAETNHLKTGSLFTAALEIAGLAAHADAGTRAALIVFAVELGQAFQLADDISDASASVQTLGKDVGRDAGKSTLVALLGLAAARELLAGHIDRAEAALAAVLGADTALARYARRLFLAAGT